MGYKLTDKAIESLKRVFTSDGINRIVQKLQNHKQDGGGYVQVTVDMSFGDFGRYMKEVTLAFYIGTEVLPIEPLELNKWLPIEKINNHVLEENVIFKSKYKELTMHNVGCLSTADNTIYCNINSTWYSLDDMTHFMIFEQ